MRQTDNRDYTGLSGDLITIDGTTWIPLIVNTRVPAIPGVVRLRGATWEHPKETFVGKLALVLQVLPWETVHLYNRLNDKYWGDGVPPPTPEDTHFPDPEREVCMVICEGRVIYAVRATPYFGPMTRDQDERKRRLDEAFDDLVGA